jgi:hypothetical protein
MTIYYEIRIAGVVPPGALRGFEQLAADQPTETTETMVRGQLPDQAALNGVLARLETSGIQLLGLRRQKCGPPARHGSSRSAGWPARTSQRAGPGD